MRVTTREGAHLELNRTALEILALCDGERTEREIQAEMERRYALPEGTLAQDVATTLQTLAAARAVTE